MTLTMASKSSVAEQQKKSFDMDNPDLSDDDDLDVGEFDFDDDDDDNDNDCTETLDDIELKDLSEENIAMLNSVIFGGEKAINKSNGIISTDNTNESKALVPAGSQVSRVCKPDDDDDEIDSDEEKDILRDIRDEVDAKVREEMKEEIHEYHNRLRAIEYGHVSGTTDDEKNEGLEMEGEMDPKLREAILRMNKLDKILKKRIKREREVKRERLLLEKRMKQEIAEMGEGGAMFREIKVNTEKFLALAPPPSHNEGITLDDEEENEEMPPLFQTQIDDSEIKRSKSVGQSARGEGPGDPDQKEGRAASSTSSHGKSSRLSNTAHGPKDKGKKHKKDFIKRNKELAGHADQPVAMTDDEKKRLNELLEGVDELPELEDGDAGDNLSVIESNPFQLALHPGEGFCPDNAEMKSLTSIDERLRGVMPEDDFNSVILASAASYRATPQQPLFKRVGIPSGTGEIPERFGERVLYETKEERELKARLQSIEQELDKFKAPHDAEDSMAEEQHLTDEQLDDLLDQCARNLSVKSVPETPDMSPRSEVSSRQSLLENPPRLTDEQLQQLLSEAHFPLSSRLLALREDDEKILEEEGSTEVIRAETWKAIKDANPDDENTEEYLSSVLGEEGPQNALTMGDNDLGNPLTNTSSNNSSAIQEGDNQKSSKSNKMESDHISVAAAFFSDRPARNSTHSSPVTSGTSDVPGGLPKISQSNSGIRKLSESYSESIKGGGTPAMSSRESTDSNMDSVRLPEISASSFLIHTQQGMNNAEGKDKNNLPSRQPLQMVRNDLSDMRMNSFSEDERDSVRSQGRVRRPSNGGTPAHVQPRPPAPKDRPPKT